MNILGLSTFADSSAAIIKDGKIICAIEEERLNGKKHYYGLPLLSIKECLKIADISIDDIDIISVGWNPYKGWKTRIVETVKSTIRSPKVLNKKLSVGGGYIGDCWNLLNLRKIFSQLFPDHQIKQKIVFVDHHRSHAASAFYPSPFSDANIIVADGIGESSTISLFYGNSSNLKLVHKIKFPNSLGHIYASVTGFLGFRMTSDEGKVMALASFGEDRYQQVFDQLIQFNKRTKKLTIDTKLLDYHGAKQGFFSETWLNSTGMTPRKKDEILTQKHKDLAHSLQKSIERTTFSILETCFYNKNHIPLCAAGGLFLNSVMNGKIVKEYNKNFFIQPAAGDNGVSIGSALYASAKFNPDHAKHIQIDSYHGRKYSDDDIKSAMLKNQLPLNLSCNVYSDVVDELLEGKIIGWYRGRMEFGPRALGNRSILASPTFKSIKEIVNSRVKHREEFRPFACSVLVEDVGKYFDEIHEDQFMLKVFDFKDDVGKMFPAICHIDNSCRIQTISKEQNPDFYQLLLEMKKKTGHGIILNTSLNDNGQPIVNTPDEAIRLIKNTDIDTMYMNDFFVRKEFVLK